MRKCVPWLAAVLAVSAPQSRANDTTEPECHVQVDTDKGKGGTQAEVCKDHASIGFSGPVKDVNWRTPLGGENAALPKAGRDIDQAKNDAGKAIEKAGQWVGKRLRF